jgi:hypothetical protein
MKKIIFCFIILLSGFSFSQTSSYKRDIPSYDWLAHIDSSATYKHDSSAIMLLPCMPPNPTSLTCGQVLGFNLDANGYVGGNLTSGNSGCNPCCYQGSDLDCDGVQDVSYSVENS